MHLVIVDPELSVSSHVFICATDKKESKKKALTLVQELILARALGEELAISRSLFVLTTPTLYEVFVVKDRNENTNYEYKYRRSNTMKKVSEWLMHDRAVVNFDAAVVALDSEDLTLTINVRPSSRVLIEDVDGYEEVKLDEITKLFP